MPDGERQSLIINNISSILYGKNQFESSQFQFLLLGEKKIMKAQLFYNFSKLSDLPQICPS